MENDEVDSLTLEEFIQRYPLPETGCMQSDLESPSLSGYGNDIKLYTGDVILLRSLTVDAVRVSFYDDDFYRKDIRFAGNFPGKFVVLSTQKDPTDGLGVEPVIYENIEDVSKDCPPYFKANLSNDDFTNGFCAGDRFRFVKLYHNSRGKCGVECRHMDGRRMHLPCDTIGKFQALPDTHYYTLGELANMAPVSRRLKLADDSINNKCMLDVLPIGYDGELLMHEPEFVVHVSPWNRLSEIYHLPLKSNFDLCLVTINDNNNINILYDTVRYSLPQFSRTYEDILPVECRLESYPDIPKSLQLQLEVKSNICVHSYEKIEKLLAKSSENSHYVLSRRLKAKYRFLPRTFTCVSQLLKCNIGTKLKVLEHVGCDVPKPFSMQPGDLVKIITQMPCVSSVRRGWNKSSYQIPILKCEKLNKRGSFKIIKLPLDLDLNFKELVPNEKKDSYVFQQLFDNKPELPVDVEIVQFDGNDLPLICQLSLKAFIRDPCLIVSVEQLRKRRHSDKKTSTTVNQTNNNGSRTKFFEIPDRHTAALSYIDSLHTAQFTFPRYEDIRDVAVEKVSLKMFTDLENEDMSYQTINLKPTESMIKKYTRPRSRSLSALSLGHITKSLSNLASRSCKKSACRNDSLNVTMNVELVGGIHNRTHDRCPDADNKDELYNDEGLYEDVIFPSIGRDAITQPTGKAMSSDVFTEPNAHAVSDILPVAMPPKTNTNKPSGFMAMLRRLSNKR